MVIAQVRLSNVSTKRSKLARGGALRSTSERAHPPSVRQQVPSHSTALPAGRPDDRHSKT